MTSRNSTKTRDFRADIQGMRAIAVLMVLLFHFRIAGASGGFAGVDVFFVISGFLMTNILVKHPTTSSFSVLKSFYLKRFWRIAPAYFTTVLLTLILGGIYMLPLDYQKLSSSALGTLAFISNIMFASEANYFSDDAINKPLLHTWSLGVEMQFYLIWPLAFLVVRKFSHLMQAIILTFTAATSFAAALYFASLDPELAFYGMPTRLWEFSAGALLANPWIHEKIKSTILPSIVSNILQFGALLCLAAFTWIGNEYLSWPAPYAVIPVAATVILLSANLGNQERGQISLVTRLLSAKVMVWLGEISYSLYLVHWPITCLIFFYWWPEPSLLVRLCALAICIPLAFTLYWTIERPLRTATHVSFLSSPRTYALWAMLFAAITVSISIQFGKGVPERFDQRHQTLLLEEFAYNSVPDKETLCATAETSCTPVKDSAPIVFLWGDSHAAHFAGAVSSLATIEGYRFDSAQGGACPPLQNASRSDGSWLFDKKCLRSNRRTIEKLISDADIKTVILSARWAYYAEALRFGNEPGSAVYLSRNSSDPTNIEQSRHILEDELSETVESLIRAKKKVFIVLQVPELSSNGKRCFVMQALRNQSEIACHVSRKLVDIRQKSYREIMTRLSGNWPTVTFIDPVKTFCSAQSCSNTLAGELAYSDNNHILPGAAWKIVWQERNKFILSHQ